MTQTRTLLIGLLGIVLVLAMFLLSDVRRYEARSQPPAPGPGDAAPRQSGCSPAGCSQPWPSRVCCSSCGDGCRRCSTSSVSVTTGRGSGGGWINVEVIAGTALCSSLAILTVPRTQRWRSGATMVQGGCAGLLVSLVVVMVAVLAFERHTPA